MISFTIPLIPRTKKNSLQMKINFKTKKLYPAPSKAFEQYQKDAGWYISHKGERIKSKVSVKCLFYMPSEACAQGVDLTNLLEAIDDILVHYGVLWDDSSAFVDNHDGSRVLWDEKPRTEVTIQEV